MRSLGRRVMSLGARRTRLEPADDQGRAATFDLCCLHSQARSHRAAAFQVSRACEALRNIEIDEYVEDALARGESPRPADTSRSPATSSTEWQKRFEKHGAAELARPPHSC